MSFVLNGSGFDFFNSSSSSFSSSTTPAPTFISPGILPSVLFTSCYVIIFVAFLPICTYYTYLFWTYRHHTIIVKRYGNLAMHNIAILLLFMIFLGVWAFLCSIEMYSYTLSKLEQRFSQTAFDLLLLLLSWIPTYRFGLLWYDMRYISQIMTLQWHKIIKSSFDITPFIPTKNNNNYNNNDEQSNKLAKKQKVKKKLLVEPKISLIL